MSNYQITIKMCPLGGAKTKFLAIFCPPSGGAKANFCPPSGGGKFFSAFGRFFFFCPPTPENVVAPATDSIDLDKAKIEVDNLLYYMQEDNLISKKQLKFFLRNKPKLPYYMA